MNELLSITVLNNSLAAWLVAGVWVAGAVVAMVFFKPVLITRIEAWAGKTSIHWDDALVRALCATRWFLVGLIALYPAAEELTLNAVAQRWLLRISTVAFFVQVGLCVGAFLDAWIRNARQKGMQTDPSTTSALAVLSFIARVALWSIVLLLLLDNIGFDVNALVAGLGIGGIAIGLALQNILGDLFASLSIVLDKPFQVGDFIILDEFSGTVENIGLKATRVRSLGGEMLVFSNADLTKARLRNYKLMKERRIEFSFGVAYDASPEQLSHIPAIVKNIISNTPQTRFDRAHFSRFGDSSLDFDVVYWMLVPDFAVYKDAQQAINLGLMQEFKALGVSFAFPTRTVVLEATRPIPVVMSPQA